MARRADIDLLFGMLALQNGLIEQGTLFSAFTTWARDRERAMAEILVGQGALDAQDRALLEGLVARHLERHGGDVGKSLSSLSSVDSVRQELSRLDDPDLQASLAAAGPEPPRTAGADPEQDWPATNPPSPRSATESIGMPSSAGLRFRILRPHARGGLGEVYVARDEELHREVALKQIQDRHADLPDSRSRFVQEAEITGGLEHPGIVPVYGLGHYPDGRPFYAMRLIRGDSLKEAIERFHRADGQPGRDPVERTMAVRQLLGRFVDVCNAIAYAHSRGVLHRDLKPGNVMLGPYGETLVVDWGLAKPVGRPEGGPPTPERTLRPSSGSGVTPTQMGSALGTPAYMSPEQAAGRLGELGPASDVYSLGAVLYSLLTGRIPFDDAQIEDVLRKVRAGELTPPRQVNRAVPPALEAVCLKAMAREPGGRYPSPRALADEIERWLADEPVTAWREPLAARAARWVRRHRTLAAGLMVFLGVAALASGIATFLINAQKTEAIRLRSDAVRERRRAEANLAIARGVIDEMYTKVSDQLENVSQMDDYQRTILEKARDFYEHEAIPQSDDVETRLAAARTESRLSYIYRKLDNLHDARRMAAQALERYRSLIRHDATGYEQRNGFFEVQLALGRIEIQDRRYDIATKHYREVIAFGQALMQDYPLDLRYSLNIGIAWDELGQVLLNSHQLDAAASAYRNAIAVLDKLAEERSEEPSCQTALANALDDAANLYTEENRDADSEKLRRRAVSIRRALIERQPGDIKAASNLASGLHVLSYTLSRTGNMSEAETVIREASSRLEQILRQHPDVPVNRIELSKALSHQASLLMSHDPAVAISSFRRAVQTLEDGLALTPNNSQLRIYLPPIFYELAKAEFDQRRLDDAERDLRESVRLGEIVMTQNPNDPTFRDLRGQAWLILGIIARDRSKPEEARSFFRRAADSQEALLREYPNEPQFKGNFVAILTEGLGKLDRESNHNADALASYRRAADVVDGMENKSAIDLYNLACSLAQCSALSDRQDESRAQDAARAVAALRSSIELGGCDLARVQGDSDLDPLRGRPDFQILERILVFQGDVFAPLSPNP